MSIDEAKETIESIAKRHNIEVSFDDKYGNFGPKRYNEAAFGTSIEFSKWRKNDADLMLFAFFHEFGHKYGSHKKGQSRFSSELNAWSRGENAYIDFMGEDITRKQARYMLKCLRSYAYGRNSQDNFN